MKTLGIIGGMGPQASIRFLELVIRRSIDSFGATNNDQFPRILLSSLPAPDIIENRDREQLARDMITQEAVRLQCGGADFLVMTCNTMHILCDSFINVVSIPFFSIIDTVVDAVKERGIQTVGLLGSETTMTSDLYTGPLTRAGINTIIPSPEGRRRTVNCILQTIAGNNTAQTTLDLVSVIEELRLAGAQAVILGCTELPLLVQQAQSPLPVFDSLALLADKSCDKIFLL